MNKNQNKQTKDKTTDKDYISQLKKGTEGVKEEKPVDNEDDWDRMESEEEEDAGQKKAGVVTQGPKGTSGKATKLRDLFDEAPVKTKKPATKPKKPEE
jgi:hypothetical protein